MSSKDLSPPMEKAIERMRKTRGHFYGDHGINEGTLDALYRRGLVRFEKRMCRTLKFERTYAVLVPATVAA